MTNEEYLSVVNDLLILNMSLKEHMFDEAIGELEDKMLTNQYRIAVVGEFSSGKSTFINALIGEEILYNSTIEATGVITTIQYGDKPIAHVCKGKKNDITDEIIEEIDLSNDEGRKKLNRFLDIRNKSNADHIDIYYPIHGVDKNIVFFDTPGIEKLSPQQLLMTKRIINQVNAVLFLITKKGFTELSLKVISDEHEIIGKIPSKDIMVVMTHIGEIYDEKRNAAPDSQIDKVVSEAKAKLIEKNLGEIAVIPLDSRDYLWGTNDKSYLKEKETRDEKLKGPLLEQSVYRERSRFDEFKSNLYKFLDRDNLKRSREQGIENTILFLSEAIEKEVKKQYEDGSRNQILIRNQLENQIEMACENQRKFYNRLMQQLQGHMENFLESVEEDAENEKRQKEEIILLIQQKFQFLEDINEENVNKCIDATIQDVERFAWKIEAETNKHLQSTNANFIRKCFSEQFQKIFNKEIEVQIEDASYDISLITEKNDYDVSEVINDSDLEDLKKERERETQALSMLEQSLAEASRRDISSKNDYQRDKTLLESWYHNESAKLGSRPRAKQKYKMVSKSKGILFWKKTWEEKVPDGMDYSAGLKWDEDKKDLEAQYDRKTDALELEYKAIEEDEKRMKQCKNAIAEYKSKLERLDNKIQKYKDYIERGKRAYTREYIDGKKEEVASLCDIVRMGLINQICDNVRNYINERKKEMEVRIKDELNRQVAKYETELKEKNRILSEKIKVSTEAQDNALNNILKIKEKITNGKAV